MNPEMLEMARLKLTVKKKHLMRRQQTNAIQDQESPGTRNPDRQQTDGNGKFQTERHPWHQAGLTQIDRVDRALMRIDDGSYGTCHTCGSAIDEDRLSVMPETERCTGCLEKTQNGHQGVK